VIIRNKSSIHSAGRFLYHRVNAYETAWHAYKDKAGGSQSDYRTTVGFGNIIIEVNFETTLPPYCNVVDNYVPPKGPEHIRSNGRPVRVEQKSVKLLQDVIRLFAPKLPILWSTSLLELCRLSLLLLSRGVQCTLEKGPGVLQYWRIPCS
jgi:hypothetical protein